MIKPMTTIAPVQSVRVGNSKINLVMPLSKTLDEDGRTRHSVRADQHHRSPPGISRRHSARDPFKRVIRKLSSA